MVDSNHEDEKLFYNLTSAKIHVVYKDTWMQFFMSVSFQLYMYNSFPLVNQYVFIMSDYCTFILLPLEGP